jgi:hypothetical protein
MPPNAERRPGKGGVQDGHGEGNVTASVAASPFRRRREAARRLPVLASGYHDPLDEVAAPVRRDRRCARAVLTANGTWRPCCGRGAA